MAPKATRRIVRAVTQKLWERDRLQMRAADALLSVVGSKRRRPKRPAGKRLATRAR